jgi:hypothetical protein
MAADEKNRRDLAEKNGQVIGPDGVPRDKLIYDVDKDPNKEFFENDDVLRMAKQMNDANPYT